MTSILKKQLSFWCAAGVLGGALLWNSGALRAQDDDEETIWGSRQGLPRLKLSRDEAAKTFTQILAFDANAPRGLEYQPPSASFGDAISRKNERELGRSAAIVLEALRRQWKQPDQIVSVQSETDKTATVLVENDPKPAARPIILVQENGGWAVDLVATYGAWNGLDRAATAGAIYKLTSVILDDLPLSNEFRRSHCQTNMKQISLGILQYIQDYDEKFPLAKPWIDAIMPYVKSEQIFKCPSVTDAKGYGYAYNSKLSNKYEGLIPNSAETVSLYETGVLKRNAYGIGENRAFRHEGGANYAFADGHIKWFDQSAKPSFNIGNAYWR